MYSKTLHNVYRDYVGSRIICWIIQGVGLVEVKMYSKTLICVQRLCRIEIIPDYTGVGLDRLECTF